MVAYAAPTGAVRGELVATTRRMNEGAKRAITEAALEHAAPTQRGGAPLMDEQSA